MNIDDLEYWVNQMNRERMPVEQQRIEFDCPPWCVREDHDADEDTEQHPPMHYGPDYGQVSVQWSRAHDYEAVVFLTDEDGVGCTDPEELRRVAAQMIQAADWLEGQKSRAAAE